MKRSSKALDPLLAMMAWLFDAGVIDRSPTPSNQLTYRNVDVLPSAALHGQERL